jgi:hypothetical protein
MSLVLVAVITACAWGCHQLTKPAPTAAEKVAVGQCVKLDGIAMAPKVDITNCDSTDANYKVAAREDDDSSKCPDSNDTSVTQTGSDSYNLCLQLNVKQGDCIEKSSLSATTKVACASATGGMANITTYYRVTDVLTGTTDDSGCSQAATQDLKYTEPDPMVVCLGPVGTN